MFNMGFTELIFLAVIALVVIGPKQLPEVARTLARLLNEFKRATSDVTSSFRDIKKEAQKTIDDTTSAVTQNILDPDDDKKDNEEEPKKDKLNTPLPPKPANEGES